MDSKKKKKKKQKTNKSNLNTEQIPKSEITFKLEITKGLKQT